MFKTKWPKQKATEILRHTWSTLVKLLPQSKEPASSLRHNKPTASHNPLAVRTTHKCGINIGHVDVALVDLVHLLVMQAGFFKVSVGEEQQLVLAERPRDSPLIDLTRLFAENLARVYILREVKNNEYSFE